MIEWENHWLQAKVEALKHGAKPDWKYCQTNYLWKVINKKLNNEVQKFIIALTNEKRRPKTSQKL